MVKIKTPQELTSNIILHLYDNTNKFIGVIDNEFTCLDILAQIKEQNLIGWYVINNNIKYPIVNGKIKKWCGYNTTGLDLIMQRLVGIFD